MYSLSVKNNIVDDEQLEKYLHHYIGECIMFTKNIWIETRLVNEALVKVVDIVYGPYCKPPCFFHVCCNTF